MARGAGVNRNGSGASGFTGYRWNISNSNSGMNHGNGLPLQVQPPAAPNSNQLNLINNYAAANYGNGGGSNAAVGGGGAADGGECTVREQDRFLPIANVVRIMRKILPGHAKISDDAKDTVQECVSEFINFVTGEANDRCQREHRKTITAEDVLWAMSKLGFDDYIEPLNLYLQCHREFDAAAALGDHQYHYRAGAGSSSDALLGKRSAAVAAAGGVEHHPPASGIGLAPPAGGPPPPVMHFLPHHNPAAPAGFFTPPPPPPPPPAGFLSSGSIEMNNHPSSSIGNVGAGPSSSSSQSAVVAEDNGEEDHQDVEHGNKD
ncbi:OLC1v1004981C1 [Oldenlandia corymbosa var. corymbosa]|uniref:OLC1v1004981C1 n=1 Tax=Oldenlandia corymbosa var. corymbosa TaxID=529605 RepID=A0AAV1DDJ4_OLDCO|nr:OLC1v1004981C1 [Oldenlandia corymbosa var. corymbosa]